MYVMYDECECDTDHSRQNFMVLILEAKRRERERDEATEQSSVFSEFSLAGSRSLLLLSFHSTFLVSASGSLGHTEIILNFKRAKTGDQPLFLIFSQFKN